MTIMVNSTTFNNGSLWSELLKIKPQWVYTRKKVNYLNIPCAFDIETSSFYKKSRHMDCEEKQAIMYIWMLSINGTVFIGRTYEELLSFLDLVYKRFKLHENRRIILYVHNLSFEFQFLQHWFKWSKVFSLDKRKPIQATTIDGIEFRCSYLLSGYKLETVAKNLHTHKIEKMVGDLDYSVIRNSKTILTDEELQYCINDVQIVVAYITELIEQCGDISKIPLTKTGFVRNICRNACLSQKDKKEYKKYKRFIHSLNITPDEFCQLQDAFAGGFTHANPLYANETIDDVDSFDFTSSYPYVAISERFPMKTSRLVMVKNKEEFEKYIKLYCCLFDIKFTKIKSKVYFDNYISKSHCKTCINSVENNGRIVSADEITLSITEQDYLIIKAMYEWEDMQIRRFRIYERGYLPTQLVKVILQKYNDKTTLKGVIGKESEYLNSKENVNSIYGMMVTNPCRDEIFYEQEWTSQKPDLENAIKLYNSSVKRFLFYPWGVWITAYARKNLFLGILNFREDYVYADTDSCKIRNKSRHMDFIEYYNKNVIKKLEMAMKYHGLDIELTRPKNIKGEVCQIGIWDFDGHYDKFKTLGAKRYMIMHKASEKEKELYPRQVYKGNFYNLTVAGLRKDYAIPYLLDTYKENIFKYFNENLYIPPEHTGKMTHTYLDFEQKGVITDYQGNTAEYYEKSSLHLENCDYSLSLTDQYIQFLFGIKNYIR